jgi:hypothetical protein
MTVRRLRADEAALFKTLRFRAIAVRATVRRF